MCGIFCYLGSDNGVDIVIDGLSKLEYRGYDSAGIAAPSSLARTTENNSPFARLRKLGKISELKEALSQATLEGQEEVRLLRKAQILIAHTRWATHGKPSTVNAHPHCSPQGRVCLVHNGIIENFQLLRQQLQQQQEIDQPLQYQSGTDTEVLAALLDHSLRNMNGRHDLVLKNLSDETLQGSYAIAYLYQAEKNSEPELVVYCKDSPLILAEGKGSEKPTWLVSSDVQALCGKAEKVMHLREGEIAIFKADQRPVFLKNSGEKISDEQISTRFLPLIDQTQESFLGSYKHYMRKEIDQQPEVFESILRKRVNESYATAMFPELDQDKSFFGQFSRVQILACGSSWHAGLIASSLLQDWARVPVDVEISSEFRYKNPIVSPRTLVIAISQSGETADTLAAINELKAKDAYVLGLCNVPGSSLDRIADAVIPIDCGPEVSVASTKAFTAQILILTLIALKMGRERDLEKDKASAIIKALKKIPSQVQEILDQEGSIKGLAQHYAHYKNFFFIGRRYMYPVALEGALKLKEISYINANGYAAGELKHGPISLIHPDCPTLAFFSNEQVFQKTLSNVMEIKARGGKVLAVTHQKDHDLESVVDHVFIHPKSLDPLMPILTTVFTQLFSYHVAGQLQLEIDRPRNLAKSVTVE